MSLIANVIQMATASRRSCRRECGYLVLTAGRECPECGERAPLSIERFTLLAEKPPIAAPRWDCPGVPLISES